MAYTSNESGRDEIFVRPFPAVTSAKFSVSTGGGDQVRWRNDGRELFFLAPDRKLMAVDVKTKGTAFEVGIPHMLFQTRISSSRLRFDYAVSRDGQRFLINSRPENTSTSAPITIVLNWAAGLNK